MPNERVPRQEYATRVRKNIFQGAASKSVHMLARNMPFPRLRVILYRWMGVKAGRDVQIGLDSFLDDQFAMAMDLQGNCRLGTRVTTVVHDDIGRSEFGPGSIFRGGQLFGHVGPITVRSGAIVGAHAELMPGVIVGEKAIVRPGAVVTRDVPEGTVVAGSPAKVTGAWQGKEAAGMGLLPKNYELCEAYDKRVPKSWLKLAFQYLMLSLARFTLPTRLRVAMYRVMGARVGRNVYIGVDTYLDERYPELITFEENSGPSFRSTYITHGETYDADGNLVRFVAPIVVKEGAWSGSNTVVCPGVTIGRGVIVGSGSVITEDVPDYAVVVGNPARVIKIRQPGAEDNTAT